MNFYVKIVWGITIFSWILANLSQRYPIKKRGALGQPLPSPFGAIIPALVFTVFAGLRSTAGDTYYYIHSYLSISDNPSYPALSLDYGGLGYDFLQVLIRRITPEYWPLIMLTSALSIIPVIIILYRFAYPFDLAIFLYVTTGYFSLSMNGIRQYVATGILLLGTKYLFSIKKGDWVKFLLFILAAYFFHKSAIIMIPLYLLVRRPAWKPITFAMLFGSVVALVFFDMLMPSFLGALEESSYSNYAENGWFTSGKEGGSNALRVIVAAVPVVLAYIYRKRMKFLGPAGDILINLNFVHMAFYVISLYNWIFARLAIYTSVYFIILLVWVFQLAFDPKDKPTVYFVMIILFSIYFSYLYYTVEGYSSEILFPDRWTVEWPEP